VAVDTAGTVYITDGDNHRVLKLPAGSTTPVELLFTGMNSPEGVAVDTAGNVYVTYFDNNRVLKLPAG
jgi:serine/threonine protein kinase, bacterial